MRAFLRLAIVFTFFIGAARRVILLPTLLVDLLAGRPFAVRFFAGRPLALRFFVVRLFDLREGFIINISAIFLTLDSSFRYSNFSS